MSTSYDLDLQSYFTDMEHLRGMFTEYVSAPTLPKRLIVFHGVGGVGKSSLLRMFRLHCKNEKIPVGLASGDDAKSALDVITRWAEDLKADGIKFPALSKTLEAYRAIQAKVEDQAKQSQNKVADIASKVASKTAEAAGGALLGAALGSIIPGLGTIAGAVSGLGAEALTDWLRGFLSKPDIDLLLDPAKKLSADFLEDLAKAAGKKRLVLLLDTFEQMSALEEWVGEVAQKVHPNVLVVIAGRKLPGWERVWSGWMMNAQVEELKPMTEEIMRELIHRYYATMRGGEPAPAQVEAIIRFARGLPMVVTSAVQLWVKYGVEDFQSVKAEIVANLVDRLMEGVPGNLIPALEAAAAVRWFDQPILRAVTRQDDVRDVYNELRRFPFVRTRIEGLALHDSVREILDENLRVQDSERHAELHERAAAYFEKRLEKAIGEESERLGLERLYHRIRADEETGIKLFQEMAEELSRYRLVNRLRSLFNDANTYPLERENSKLWIQYYESVLAFLEVRFDDAQRGYLSISENKRCSAKLRGYALCELGDLFWLQKTVFGNGIDRLVQTKEQIDNLLPESDPKRIGNLVTIGKAYQVVGQKDKALECLEDAVTLYKNLGDLYGLAESYSAMLYLLAAQGDWNKWIITRQEGLKILPQSAQFTLVYARLVSYWSVALTWAGRYAETERNARQSLTIEKDLGTMGLAGLYRDLGLSLGMQGKYNESAQYFNAAIENRHKVNNLEDDQAFCFYASILLRQGNWQLADEYLEKSKASKEKKSDQPGFLEVLDVWGKIDETRNNWQGANLNYQHMLNYHWTGRRYFECTAFTGLARVKHAQGDIAAIPALLAEAEQLAQQYEYNDHLASLRLTQGHLAWESGNQAEAMAFYKQAMIYALRYNRFLLDELVSGRPQGTPLRPIIPACLERGEAGKTMLLALRDWWKTGINDIGAPRPNTISPIPEGLALLEAEKLAREREPGDGSAQKSVVEQLEATL